MAVQAAFAALLRDGYVDAVVRAARRTYAERAARVVAALSPYAQLAGPVAGMYSTWLVPSTYRRSADLSGLVVGFAGPDDDELDHALDVLTQALA